MGTTAQKLQHLANVKADLKAAFIEQGQEPTDVIATYPGIVRNMETSIDGENITAELNAQTATADELVAIAKRKYFETLNTGIYVWKKLTAEGGDFIEYVVSGEETTYPDGGTQDGYWYEMVEEGATGIDYGVVTTTQSSITFFHNLGVTPNKIYLVMEGAGFNSNQTVFVLYDTAGIENANYLCWHWKRNSNGAVNPTAVYASSVGNVITADATQVTISKTSSVQLSGRYTWVVIA